MASPDPRPQTQPTDADPLAQARSDARAARIAAAVERSKTEYQPQHAYTERGWFLATEHAGPSKKDRQRVEYAATHRLLCRPAAGENDSAARALEDILSCLPLRKGASEDGDAADTRDLGKLPGMPRELLGTALRAASEAGRPQLAAEIARSLRKHWKANPGLALASSDALAAVSAPEALRPLFVITAVAVHYPILAAMAARLDACLASPSTEGEARAELETLARVAHCLAANRAWGFEGDLFSDEPRRRPPPAAGGELREPLHEVNRRVLERAIGVDGGTLEQALTRMRRALGRSEDEVVIPEGERNERGVRDL